MSVVKKYLIHLFWILTTGVLLYLSLGYYDSTSSILAQVEPEKYAISFQKAVRIKEIYVIPGQQVKKGDKLLRADRPDLLLDVESKTNQLNNFKSQLQVSEIERENQLTMENLVYEQKIVQLESEIEQLELIVDSHAGMSKSLSSLNVLTDSSGASTKSEVSLQLSLRQKEKASLIKQHQLKIKEIGQLYEIKILTLNRDLTHVQNELNALMAEEKELIQYASQDGTIGNIYTETHELVSPYTTLMSIYSNNPTIIRALINEHQSTNLTGGDEVIVESTNRQYEISGVVLEIGSRIIEYPSRLRTFQEVPVYGREIFIQIPVESNFLNGEKVFVKLDK